MSLARPPRAPRRAPTELTFLPDEALLDRWSDEEPDWLTADRRAALERVRALPTTFFITPEGVIDGMRSGAYSPRMLHDRLNQFLGTE